MEATSITDRVATLLDAVSQPAYTGPNRCGACTVVNLCIATALGAGVGAFSVGAGVGVAVLSVGTIYLRGYLVPGTPTLTKRYLPDRVLAWFDAEYSRVDDVANLDAETLLLRTGAVVADGAVDDLVLDPGFDAAWRARVAELGSVDAAATALAAMLDVDATELEFDRHGDAFVAWRGDRWLGQWESRGAFLADVAAAAELDARSPGWNALPLDQRSRTLGLLRLFLERCPTCDGAVVLGEDVVESCCRSVDVIAATCRDCGDRLFEAPYDPAAVEVGDGGGDAPLAVEAS